MKIAPKIKRWVFGSCGVLLFLAGCYAGYFWHYKYAPVRRLYNSRWARLHSSEATWLECQKSVRRGEWFHEAGFSIGHFGDKAWVKQLIARTEAGGDMDCWLGHPATALRHLSNQDAGDTSNGWLVWWKENELKSQEDWIREGFRQQGIVLESPLSKNNIVQLLTLVGGQSITTTNKPPQYASYNAYRWLRDSDYDPTTFSVTDLPASNGDIVLHGLVHYAKLLGWLPKSTGLGVLKLGKPVPTEADIPKALIERWWWFGSVANLVIVLLVVGGVFLIRLAVRLRQASA